MRDGSSRQRERAFEEFVRGQRAQLLSFATALTAGDVHLAEDLVQTTLTRVYLSWRRAHKGHPQAYARRTLLNCFLDHRRRRFVKRERVVAQPPDTEAWETGSSELDPALMKALAQLPPGMRAAVVLRHVYDLSVDEAAHVLACSAGTVKSQTARGLEKLRAQLECLPTTLEGDKR